MNRKEINKVLSVLNFESVLLHRTLSGDIAVEQSGPGYFCEGDREGWDPSKGPDTVGCDEAADWYLKYQGEMGEWFCTSCLVGKIQGGTFEVVCGAVTLDFSGKGEDD